MRNKSKFSLKRFIKTGRFNLPQTTLDKIEHYYYLRNELKLNDEVYNLIAGFVNFLNPRPSYIRPVKKLHLSYELIFDY